MAEYKVLKNYRDKQLEKSLKANDKVEMTVKRAEEVEKLYQIKAMRDLS